MFQKVSKSYKDSYSSLFSWSMMENQEEKYQTDLNHRKALLERAKEVTTGPGVYLFKDGESQVLYVGKAKNLRSRLSSYFQLSGMTELAARTQILVQGMMTFEVMLTETETEALLLEWTLIKKHKPRYNVRLKDDKAYPFIKIQVNEPFPRLEWTRRVMRDQARYFGPFPSAWAARQVLQLLNHTFRLRDCSDNTFMHRTRPCILFEMGRCTAPCVKKISEKDYRESIQQCVDILEGKTDKLLQILKKGMEDASEHLEYEQAASYRDQIQHLELITETQGVHLAGKDWDRDVVGVAREGSLAQGALLQIRDGKMVAVKHYHLQNADADLPDAELLFDFLAQHYILDEKEREKAAKSEDISARLLRFPKDVLLPLSPEDPELIEKAFGVGVKVPETKEEQQLVHVAHSNAKHALDLNIKKAAGHGLSVLEDIRKVLHLAQVPHRIECYDISNIQGDDAVASRVVFVDGAPEKNLYRKYKIRTVQGSNDFAMMKEVLGRRFSRAEDSFPDLVVVDGGKGQLSQATAILDELLVQGVDVVALAKAKVQRDFKAQKIQASAERIFLPNRKNPVFLKPGTGVFKLLTHLRDEAHRFAIQYHRQVRQKRTVGFSS